MQVRQRAERQSEQPSKLCEARVGFADVVQKTESMHLDERGASASAARHLHDLGHRRAGHIAMQLQGDSSTAPITRADVERAGYADARDRALGFMDVFGDGSPMVETALPDVDQGRLAGLMLLDVPAERRPTAVVAQSDLLALGAIRAAEDLGLRVPDDVSVTGFDGVELHFAHAYTMASFLSPLNTRDDGFGGMREGRVRLPLEVIAAVKGAVDPGFAVGCRFLAEERIGWPEAGGGTAEDAAYFGVEFARAGLDWLSLSRGGKFEDAKAPKIGWAAYPYTGPSGYECMPTAISDAFGPFGRNVAATGRRASSAAVRKRDAPRAQNRAGVSGARGKQEGRQRGNGSKPAAACGR